MNWPQIQVGEWWPLLLGLFAFTLLVVVWHRRKGDLFPDVHLLSETASMGGMLDRLPLIMGIMVVSLLILTLMDISTTRSVTVNKRSRDFLVIVDTSRSMRENTSLLRSENPPTYERRTGLFSGQVDDPGTIPELARYELAREGLLRFMSTLNEQEDRIQLIYFNSQVYLMSGFTTNFPFIRQQLENMDPYVTYGTNIRWALETGLDMLERYPSGNRRAVILLTDAEARSTQNLQEQLDRLSRTDVSFYLLWITSDIAGEVSAQAGEFLRNVRSIGSVFTIADLAEGSLDDAMRDIGKLENYAYDEIRYERIDLSEYVFTLARWLMLLWILLVATLYHPSRLLAFSANNKSR
jgi:Mg-chelatase subunit ChlD